MPCQGANEKTPACQLRAGPVALAVVGISHQTSTIEEREPLQLGRDELPQVDSSLVSLPGVHEATAICTCNRIEFYLVLRDAGAAGDVVAQMYRERRNLDLSSLRDTLYERVDGDAVRHLLRVAAGVDSMVLGETQIFGQIKQAYTQACSVKSAGKILHRLFHQAFRTGKRVR
jgi:glutamyl-tRNA reductase